MDNNGQLRQTGYNSRTYKGNWKMELQTRYHNPVKVLELAGRFDAHTVPAVNGWLKEAMAGSQPQVVINLAQVHFVDSAALAALVNGMKQCNKREGAFRLCSLQQTVRIIFELTRLDKAFDIFDSEEDAVTLPIGRQFGEAVA
jgi:anti-sigma B factor antagonist